VKNLFVKTLFIAAAIAGIVAVFFASWFWRLLLIPMILILLWDGVRSLWGRKG